MNEKIIVKIEVCQGPDCFGSGGGAAFLELEDLASNSIHSCQFHNNNNNNNNNTSWSMTVVTGGCRNFCAMGPNVHYHDQHNVHQHHFTKVQSVQQCRVVLQHHLLQQQQHLKNNGNIDIAGDDDDNDDEAVVGNGSIMMQRAEKKRWAFLRQVARAKKVAASSASSASTTRQNNTPSGSRHDRLSGLIRDLETELEHVIAAELSACCSSQKDNINHKAQLLERVGKRKIHYQDILKSLKPAPPKEEATSITGTR